MTATQIEHIFKMRSPFQELAFPWNAEQTVNPKGGHLPGRVRHRQKIGITHGEKKKIFFRSLKGQIPAPIKLI